MTRCLLCLLIIAASLCLPVTAATSPAPTLPSAVLARVDRLPELAGDMSSYRIGYLPATATQFMLFALITGESLGKTGEPGNIWVNTWGSTPLGKPLLPRRFDNAQYVITRPDNATAALVIPASDASKKTSGPTVLIFRALSLAATVDLTHYPTAIPDNISAGGQISCRLGTSNQALFFSPNQAPTVRTFPCRFLAWDFPRQRAILTNGTHVRAMRGDAVVFDTALPFIADRASVFEDGGILTGSEHIIPVTNLDINPRWFITLDQNGARRGSAVIDILQQCPDRIYTLTPERKVRRISDELIAVADGKLFRYAKDRLQPVSPAMPMSLADNFPCEVLLCDSRGNIYVQQYQSTSAGDAVDEERIVVYRDMTPVTLLTNAEIAKHLGIAKPWIYAVDVSQDGTWLGMTVTDYDHPYAAWWLLQFRLTHPPDHIDNRQE